MELVSTTFKMNGEMLFEVSLSLSSNCFFRKVVFVFSNNLNMYFECGKSIYFTERYHTCHVGIRSFTDSVIKMQKVCLMTI